MKKILLASLFASSLVGCSQQEPIPTPNPAPPARPATTTLAARWQVDSSWVSGGTATTISQKNGLKVFPAGSVMAEITSSSYMLYAAGMLDKKFDYILVGNVMQPVSSGNATDIYSELTIKTLTATRLVLVSLTPTPTGKPNEYATSTITCSR